jgi:potassium voltage-gated channel Eag-related subfamily H protein 8
MLLNFASWLIVPYNGEFCIDELLASLYPHLSVAPGPDVIHTQVLSYPPATGEELLLSLCNRIWSENLVPSAWRIATIILILKPGKDCSSLANYRPVSLTSYVCKTMECVVNHQLEWLLENKNLLLNAHCGFQWHISTLDHLVNLKNHIQNSFIVCQQLVAVFWLGEGVWHNLELQYSQDPPLVESSLSAIVVCLVLSPRLPHPCAS